jgi:N-methylhydantoinase A/oxoprolinase/acetone carboxylase beta subunit
MSLALGIDTGGTYTDAVLVNHESGQVVAAAKALTTYGDLSIGIGEALSAALDQKGTSPAAVKLVALSTTLATNAIVEGRGSPVALLLVGYDPGLIRQYGFEHDLVTGNVVYVAGGHDAAGNEVSPLDEAAAREAILANRDRVDAFSVSGYFGVRNPAHEQRVRQMIEELTDLPVTCGHELTTRLNAVRRATTATLNATLIPLLRELIGTVQDTLRERGIAAPLMVVRGDGSLVRAVWALRRPIETILSGPAASVVGAWHLAGRGDVWVVDVGGTTTDIATLREGRPRLSPSGAQVGAWRTMVEAVDVHTVGLGGDSEVQIGSDRRPVVGPRRAVPLCLLAENHPQVVAALRKQLRKDNLNGLAGQFLVLQRRPARHAAADNPILQQLDQGPISLADLVESRRYGMLVLRQVQQLESERVLVRSCFTPTDALHVLDRYRQWDSEASRLGAELLASRARMDTAEFCERVASTVSDRVATELVTKVLSDEATEPNWDCEPAASALLARALGASAGSDLECTLGLRQPVVAVGAPVGAYLPRTSSLLRTELVIPQNADVANAVGAVAGGVVQQRRVLIRPVDSEAYFRVFLPEGMADFTSLEEAVAWAEQEMTPALEALAQQAGADQVEVQMTRSDRHAPVDEMWGQDVYLETELVFTAAGRPSIASDGSSG